MVLLMKTRKTNQKTPSAHEVIVEVGSTSAFKPTKPGERHTETNAKRPRMVGSC